MSSPEIRNTSERMEQALRELEPAKPARDLAQRIIATLPRSARQAPANPWLGVSTLFTALLGFALAYQTAFILRANGVFELLSYYTAQPEIVTTYPAEAWTALSAVIPWVTVTVSVVTVALALWLMYRWSGRGVAQMTG